MTDNRQTTRTFQCREALWACFEQMARELECSVDYLLNDAMKQYARQRGYIDIFERAGAELIDPSCGACINAGPGASPSAETVTVSAQNRNFPGRSGPGKLYLASPYVVAASAIAGKIVDPKKI